MSINENYKNISKKELFDKLSKLSLSELKKWNISPDEINYLKNKILNDKLGLVLNFEEKDEYLDNHYFGLEEVKELHINPKEKNNHLLIEGDNYYALKALQVSGIKVDVIYIDPPYNTGNKDFVYNDSFVEKDDQFKHSKWLSFMKKRLELARELLSDDGVIFVSIDDNEQAYLKVLMDEIFGEENFITNIIVELTKTQGMKVGAAKNGSVVKGYENILMYSKNLSSRDVIVKKILYDKADTRYDTHYNQYWDSSFKNPITISDWLKNQHISVEEFNKFKLTISTKNIDMMMNLSPRFNDFILKNSENIFHCRNIDLEEIQKLDIEINKVTQYKKYLLYKKDEKSKIQQLQSMKMSIVNSDDYISEYRRSTIRGNLWKGFDKDLSNLDKEGGVIFKNGKKPIRLIKQLIQWIDDKKDSLILDFFAGSGTTGEAVLELNKENNSNKRFILCTNNENNIAQDICLKRLLNWLNNDNKHFLFMKYLRVKPIHNVDGNYEEINDMKEIYKDEFDKDLSIKDFR